MSETGPKTGIVPSEQPLIELYNVSKRFRIHREQQRSWQEIFIRLIQRKRKPLEYFWPLRNVSMVVNPGDSIGILGPNGSGKSTLLKLITGILEPTGGDITVRGRVSSLLELGAGFHHDLTGRENIYLNGSVHGLSRGQMMERIDSIVEFAELGDFIDTPVKHYSSGMYVRLGFAVAIHTDPEVLIVDEVLTVGDQIFQQKCLEWIYTLKRRGVAIVLVSHSLADVERLCDRAIWIHGGDVRAEGKSSQVVDQYVAFSNEKYYRQRKVAQEKEAGKAELPAPLADVHAQYTGKTKSYAQRWGTYQAEIIRVELLNQNGVSPQYFEPDLRFCLRITYQAYERIEKPAFGLAFYRQDGAHVNGPNSVREGVDIPFIEGLGVVEYTIDSLPLNPGNYDVTVAIYDENSTIAMDHQHRMYEMEVRTNTLWHEEGVVHIPARWAHHPRVN